MAFGRPRFKTSAKIIAALAVLGAVAIPIVGPFTFYGTVVPYLTPIIPKPDGIPQDAQARHNWKGPGLFWVWERELSIGCARWSFVEDRWVTVGFGEGHEGCDASVQRFRLYNFRDEGIDLGVAGGGAMYCNIHRAGLSQEDNTLLRDFISKSGEAAISESERRMVALSWDFVSQPEPDSNANPCL